MKSRQILAGLILGSMVWAPSVQAANHPLTQIVHDAKTGTAYIDLVVAIDWNPDNPPARINGGNGSAEVLNRDFVANVMQSASDLLYTMTEGKLRLGKMSVYVNQFLDNADVIILHRDGRANANINGVNFRGARNQMFTAGFGQDYSAAGLGLVVAHEFGHYMLGAYDEYREVGQLDTSSPGRPQDRDTPRDTIMTDQSRFNSLSTPADYTDPLARQTAHYRYYSQSAWETLIADPAKNDLLTIQNNWPRRIWFDAFKGMSVPTSLTKPVNPTAARASMQMTYMNGSNNVIVIDLGVKQSTVNGFIKSAEGVLDTIPVGSSVTVMTIAGTTVATVVPTTALDAAGSTLRNQIKTTLKGLSPSTATTGPLDSILTQAAVIASPLAKARDDAAKTGATPPNSNAVDITKTPVISLFSTNSASVGSTAADLLAKGAVMLNSALVSTDGADGNIIAIAAASRGTLVEASSTAALERKVVAASNQAKGLASQAITSAYADSLTGGGTLNMTTPIGASSIDGDVTFTAYVGGNDGVTFTLKSPAGGIVTVANAISFGITSKVDTDEGIVSFTLPASLAARTGQWVATATASNTTVDPIEMEATVASLLTVKSQISGGTSADPRKPVLTAALSQPMAVKGASLFASIYDAKHNLVKDKIPMLDGGVAPDLSPGDGIYTAALDGIITKAGEYEIVIDISNANGTAKYGTGGSRIAGLNTPDVPIAQNFQREDFVSFVFTPAAVTAVATATPTTTNAAPSSSGGGCTLGRNSPFDPVFPVLVAAAGLYVYRRNRKR